MRSGLLLLPRISFDFLLIASVFSLVPLGADMSQVRDLLGRLASHREEWEIRKQRAVPQVPINQIEATMKELEQARESLSASRRVSEEKRAAVDSKKAEAAKLQTELEDLLRRQAETSRQLEEMTAELENVTSEVTETERRSTELTGLLERLQSERLVDPQAHALWSVSEVVALLFYHLKVSSRYRGLG